MAMQKGVRRSLFGQNVRQAIDIIRAHRMRSGLLILGVAIGITTILSIVTVMTGLVAKINADLESSHKPYMFVTRFDVFQAGDEEDLLRRKNLEPADAQHLAERCPSLEDLCYLVQPDNTGFDIIYYRGEHTPPIELDGASHTFPKIFSLPLEHGRFYTEREVERRERVVVLGYGPAKDLFPHENPLGKLVDIRNKKYQVIGTFANREHFIGAISNNFAVLPYTSYYKDFQTDAHWTTIAATVVDGVTLEQGQAEIVNELRIRRGVQPGKENDFHITTSTAFLDIVGSVTLAVSGVLTLIASIGLVVGGIGVMNIMLISVAERTREIGVRMAMGATSRDIMQQFLTEAATLTGIGGVVGTGFGVVVAYLIANRIHFPFQFSLSWTVLAIVFSAVIGIIFGIYPARRASRLDPVEALRFE